MRRYRLTIRQGAKVEREKFDSLDEAIAVLRRRAEEISSDADLPTVSLLRDFKAEDRVAARLEISSGGMMRGSAAGLDVMGDGAVVPFAGGVTRKPLDGDAGDPYRLIEQQFSG